MDNKKIYVCVLSSEELSGLTDLCLKTFTENAGYPFRFIFLNIGHSTLETDQLNVLYHDYTLIRTTNNEFNLKIDKVFSSTFEAKQYIFDALRNDASYSDVDFLCFLPVNCLIGQNSLVKLLTAYNEYLNCGILGLREYHHKNTLSHYTFESSTSELTPQPIWQESFNFVTGLQFMSKQIAKEIGYLKYNDQYPSPIYEEMELCAWSSILAKKRNFYIFNGSAHYFRPLNNLSPKPTKLELHPMFRQPTRQEFKAFKEFIDKEINLK